MQYCLLSDIHSNLEALTACLGDYVLNFRPGPETKKKITQAFQKRNIHFSAGLPGSAGIANVRVPPSLGKEDKIICLGDIIGYGPNPNECFGIISEIADQSVLGNHEVMVMNPESRNMSGQPNDVTKAAEFTRESLDPEFFLKIVDLYDSQKYLYLEKNLCFSHGLPVNPGEFHYPTHPTMKDFFYYSLSYAGKLCFCGHSHIPLVLQLVDLGFDFKELEFPEISYSLDPDTKAANWNFLLKNPERALITIPSVGQPRDFLNYSGYAVYDSEEKKLFLRRIPYDFRETARKIIQADLPESLAERLKRGY